MCSDRWRPVVARSRRIQRPLDAPRIHLGTDGIRARKKIIALGCAYFRCRGATCCARACKRPHSEPACGGRRSEESLFGCQLATEATRWPSATLATVLYLAKLPRRSLRQQFQLAASLSMPLCSPLE